MWFVFGIVRDGFVTVFVFWIVCDGHDRWIAFGVIYDGSVVRRFCLEFFCVVVLLYGKHVNNVVRWFRCMDCVWNYVRWI